MEFLEDVKEILFTVKYGDISLYTVLFRLCMAFALSAVIGGERVRKSHSAWLRSFVLVGLVCSSAVMLDRSLGNTLPLISGVVVLAVAWISGYSIYFGSNNQIKGFTTAVMLFGVVIIGLGAGAGFYSLTLGIFALLLICIYLLPPLEAYLKSRSLHFDVHLELNDKQELYAFITAARHLGMRLDDIEANPSFISTGLAVYTVSFTIVSEQLKKFKNHSDIVKALSTLECVSYIEMIGSANKIEISETPNK